MPKVWNSDNFEWKNEQKLKWIFGNKEIPVDAQDHDGPTRKRFPWDVPFINIDFAPEFLQYNTTVILLLIITILLGFTQFFGAPINCTAADDDGSLNDMANYYCYIHSTYSAPTPIDTSLPAHPGVRQVRLPIFQRKDNDNKKIDEGEVRHHRYYIWIHLIILVQALCFYIPRYFWKSLEDGRMAYLVSRKILNHPNVDTHQYFKFYRGWNQFYFIGFLLSQFLYLFNVLIQGYLLNNFLGTIFGKEILGFMEMDPEFRDDHIEALFPKVTKCTFNKYGPSGNIVNHDFICLLPFNVFNEKLFIFMWFWLQILTILNIGSLIFWFIYSLSPRFRRYFLQDHGIKLEEIKNVTSGWKVGDVFLLYLLKRNLQHGFYHELIEGLQNDIKKEI